MATRMQQRRGTAAQWISTNNGDGPILEAGEIGFETDTGKFKIGDGINHWVDLDYFIDESDITGITGDYVLESSLGQANGVATLDENSKLTPSQLPDIAQVTVHAVANSDARLSLSVEPGDIAIQYDNGQTYVLADFPASDDGNWQPITVADVFPSKSTDDLNEGTVNFYFSNTRAQDAAANLLTSATLSNITITGDGSGITITAENGVADSTTDDLIEGANNIYFTNSRARAALEGGTGLDYNTSTGVFDIDSTVTTNNGSQTLTNKNIDLANNTVTGTVSQFNSALSDGDFATVSGAETLINKTIDLTNNTVVATLSQLNSAVSDADLASISGSETLTNKTLSLANNTVSGTVADFNTALLDGTFATLDGSETITNKVSITSESIVANTITGNNIVANTAVINTSLDVDSNDLNVGSQSSSLRATDGYTNPMAVFSIDADDNYAQLAVKNTGNGTNSSTDIIAYANNGDDDAGWTNIGFTASTFSDPSYTITGPNDGYLFVEGAQGNAKEVSNKEIANNVVTLTTSAEHGFVTNDEVVVNGVGSPFDGIYIITGTPTLSTFTYNKLAEDVSSTAVSPVGEAKVATGNGNLVLATGANGARNKIVFAAGGLFSDNTQMEILPDDKVKIDINTESTSYDTGALVVDGGVGIAGNLNLLGDLDVDGYVDFSGVQHLPIGPNAFDFSETLTNPVITAVANKDNYQQIAFKNESNHPDASTDFIAYADNGTDSDGYIDMGITSSQFADPEFTITGENDGYIFMVAPANTTGNGDLVLATGNTGARNAIVFAAGGLESNNTQMEILPDDKVKIDIETQSTSVSTGALVVNGGVGIAGNLNVQGDVNVQGTITFGGEGTTVETDNLAVSDPMIYVGNANPSDTVDLAFVGEYTSNSVTKYTGIARDADDGVWKFFRDANTKPTSTVNFSEAGLGYADLRVGGLTANSASIGSVTNAEIGHLSGVTSGIQSQLNDKLNSSTASSTYAPINNPIFTGTVSVPTTIEFEGTTANEFETSLTVVDPTADRTITLPNASGTVSLITGSETLENKTINLTNNTLSGTTAQFNTALSDGDFATVAGSETLTNKSINLANNTVTGTLAQFNTALSDADLASLAGSETLTNKTINLANNTVTGTLAQFNTALSDGDFATLAGTETLSGKTLSNVVVTGTLTANNVPGTNGQYLKTTGTGVVWDTVPTPSAATTSTLGTVYGITDNSFANYVIGFNSLSNKTSGNTNVGFGEQVLNSLTIGYNNVSIGYRSLSSIDGGFDNIAIGVDSARRLAASSEGNIAIGKNSLLGNLGASTTISYNLAIGQNSLRTNSNANEMLGIGHDALYSYNVVNGYGSTAIGHQAGRSLTNGFENTLIGYRAGYGVSTELINGSNNIIIGAFATSSSATVSGEITLGTSENKRFRIPGMEIDWQHALMEKVTVSATAATGTINYDLITNKSVLYYTSNASGNWTLNIRGNSSTTLNNLMSIGQSLTIAFLVTNGASAFYQTGFQIDGSAVTPKWQGGTAPTAGNASSIDVYSITIIKTANATFTALESQTRFA